MRTSWKDVCNMLVFVVLCFAPKSRSESQKFSSLRSTIRYVGDNTYIVRNACILAHNSGIGVFGDSFDIPSVVDCSSLFYWNEYGLRMLPLVKVGAFGNSVEWNLTRAHVVLASSIHSHWHFLHSLIPAYEMAAHDMHSSFEHVFYFMEGRKRATCRGRLGTVEVKPTPFEKAISPLVYEAYSRAFPRRASAERLEKMECHREITVGHPLLVATSTAEWKKQRRDKLRKNRLPMRYVSHLLRVTPIRGAYQAKLANAIVQSNGINNTCPTYGKPFLLIVNRSNRRRLLNQEAMVQIASTQFEVRLLAMEDYSILDQIWLFRCADAVAGVSGSGMTWIVFMRQRTSVMLFQYAAGRNGVRRMEWSHSPDKMQSGIFVPDQGIYSTFLTRPGYEKNQLQAWEAQQKSAHQTTKNWKSMDVSVDEEDFRHMLRSSANHLFKEKS